MANENQASVGEINNVLKESKPTPQKTSSVGVKSTSSVLLRGIKNSIDRLNKSTVMSQSSLKNSKVTNNKDKFDISNWSSVSKIGNNIINKTISKFKDKKDEKNKVFGPLQNSNGVKDKSTKLDLKIEKEKNKVQSKISKDNRDLLKLQKHRLKLDKKEAKELKKFRKAQMKYWKKSLKASGGFSILTFLPIILGVVSTFFGNIKGILLGALKGLGKLAWSAIKGLGKLAINGLKYVTSKAWNGIKFIAKKSWGGLKNIAQKAWGGLKNIAQKSWGGLKNIAQKSWGGVKNVGSKALNVAKNVGSKALDIGKSGLSMAKNFVRSPAMKSIGRFIGKNFLKIATGPVGIGVAIGSAVKLGIDAFAASVDKKSAALQKIIDREQSDKGKQSTILNSGSYKDKLDAVGLRWDSKTSKGSTVYKDVKQRALENWKNKKGNEDKDMNDFNLETSVTSKYLSEAVTQGIKEGWLAGKKGNVADNLKKVNAVDEKTNFVNKQINKYRDDNKGTAGKLSSGEIKRLKIKFSSEYEKKLIENTKAITDNSKVIEEEDKLSGTAFSGLSSILNTFSKTIGSLDTKPKTSTKTIKDVKKNETNKKTIVNTQTTKKPITNLNKSESKKPNKTNFNKIESDKDNKTANNMMETFKSAMAPILDKMGSNTETKTMVSKETNTDSSQPSRLGSPEELSMIPMENMLSFQYSQLMG